MRRFVEMDDPFVDYVLEDVYIRARVGEGAVRVKVPEDAEDVLELYSMSEEALDRVEKVLTSGKRIVLRPYKLRRPTPEELEQWLIEQQERPEIALPPFFGYEYEE